MPTALGNTARILRNLRLHAYKRTLIAFFLVEIVITFLFTVTVSGRNGLHSSPNLPPSPSDPHHRYSSSFPNSSTEAPVTPDGLFPLSFFSESVSILNLPLNLVGMVLVSTEAVYFTLLYFPLRYFFTVALFRLVAAAPFAYCYPLMIDLLLVVVLHFYYVRLYNVKFFGGRRSRGGDGDDQEFVIEEEETDNDSIFSVENHLHAAQLNAPPPSYTEVARNPLKYPSLVGVVEVGNSGGNASSSSAVLQLSPRRLESIEEVGEEAASAAAAAAVEGQMASTTLASTTTAAATTTTRT